MGKHEPMTAKAVAKRIKAKGLQRLRWYCQLCAKQCRDENGFQQHCATEGHLRQMRLFGENPTRFVDDFSKAFEEGFLAVLKVRGRAKVYANHVYNEYIKDRHHVHMKSTVWTTLYGFCKYLGKTGKALVEEAPRGCYLTYIDQDPRAKQKRSKEQVGMKIGQDLREKEQQRIAAEMQRREKHGDVQDNSEEISRELPERAQGEKAVSVKLRSKTSKLLSKSSVGGALKRNILEEEVEQQRKEFSWVTQGIVVKILNKEIANGELYGVKAVVEEVEAPFIARVKTLGNGSQPQLPIKIDQRELETVLPAIGKRIKIVGDVPENGRIGVLEGVEENSYHAIVNFPDLEGKTSKFEYDQICKLLV